MLIVIKPYLLKVENEDEKSSTSHAAVHDEKQVSQAGAIVAMAIPEMTVCGVWKAF